MNVSIAQIYIRPGIDFPFTHLMQRWVAEQLSKAAQDTTSFTQRHGSDFELMIFVSAESDTRAPTIKGPTIDKKGRQIEYTVFLPFDAIQSKTDKCRAAMESLMDGVRDVFAAVGVGVSELEQVRDSIVTHVCSTPEMFGAPSH